ncbi:MAG: TetR/AcrR family transcriptional regulator [Woeseiaceae bacterium]|nr:TetR/AcrR family transcriptional regulator [Woeseiaceae bacterium]
MRKPRYRRRKEERPQQITAAAFDVFAEKGYARARVQEVAERAGVSKGLMYLYFKTKEELFKAVIKSVVVRRVDALIDAANDTTLSSEEFLRGPFADFMKKIPASPVAVVIRLLVSEGPRHPDIVDYYWNNVVSKGIATISSFLDRGIANGEFRKTKIGDVPQLVVAPMIVATIWNLLFTRQPVDATILVDTQIDMLLDYLRADRSVANA